MLLVIMTKSLIRLDNTVRASLNDEERNESYARTDANDDGITKCYN